MLVLHVPSNKRPPNTGVSRVFILFSRKQLRSHPFIATCLSLASFSLPFVIISYSFISFPFVIVTYSFISFPFVIVSYSFIATFCFSSRARSRSSSFRTRSSRSRSSLFRTHSSLRVCFSSSARSRSKPFRTHSSLKLYFLEKKYRYGDFRRIPQCS